MQIIHLSGVAPSPQSGMGRVSYYWKTALEAAGYQFRHIGIADISPGQSIHPLLQGFYYRRYLLRHAITADIILAHEPICGFIPQHNTPIICFSHGVEQRAWQVQLHYGILQRGILTKLLPEALRFYSNNLGFKKATKILVLNQTDRQYLIDEKQIPAQKVQLMPNGYIPLHIENTAWQTPITLLYNGSWIPRKGIQLMVEVFNQLLPKYPDVRLRIAGTGLSKEALLANFSNEVSQQIDVISTFDAAGEWAIYQGVHFFVLPSYLEGQSLALTQAMAMGICPIVTNNSGQKDIIRHLENGLVFETGQAEAMKACVEWGITHIQESMQLGAKAQQSIEHLTWEKVGNTMVEICRQLKNHSTIIS